MSNNPTSTIDPADEAGGEAIFSSDGLPPLPTRPSIPSNVAGSSSGAAGNDEEDVIDSTSSMNPIEAFEVFSGKLYTVLQNNNDKQNQINQQNAIVDGSLLEKLARLKREVNEVEDEIKMLSAENKDGDNAAGGSSDSTSNIEKELLTLSSELATKINTLSSTSVSSQHDKLTIMLQEKMNEMKTKDSSSTAEDGDDKKRKDPNIIYELYDTSSSSTNLPPQPTSSLEERILKLEKLLGSSSSKNNFSTIDVASSSSNKNASSSGGSNETLLERLDELEKMIKRIDNKQLDVAATKAKVIRSDLEAASKARTKLNNISTSSGAAGDKFALDNKKISTLYDQLIQLEGIHEHLPALVYRLQQLSSLHKQSSSFATRLSESELLIKNSNKTITNLEETLSTLESSMISNMSIIEENMKQIDK